MFLNHIISWGMVAMLSSLTMTTGSVDRNSTSSQNNNPASVEEVTEGCATNFVCPLGTEPFYYNHNDYSSLNVQDVTKWTPGYNPVGDCIGDEVACLICVGSDFVEGEGANMNLKETLLLETFPTGIEQVKVIGSNDPFFDFSNQDL